MLKLAVVLAGFALGCALAATGWWRWGFRVFGIRARRMTVARLNLAVRDPKLIERVNAILASFARGFNGCISAKSLMAARASCDREPPLLRPFAHEGLAVGYTPRNWLRYDANNFQSTIVSARPEFRYLYYVGLGFWWGMRRCSPAQVERLTDGLDPLHRYLCFDGYGFKVAFFDHPKNANAFRVLEQFTGYARNAAYQGVGRAFYFRFMEDDALLIERLGGLGDMAEEAAAGVGLACVFVNPDRLGDAAELARRLPRAWQPQVQLGMCFALKARSIGDVDDFENNLSVLDRSQREAIEAAVHECDRIELRVRAETSVDGYHEWRRRVAAWMSEHVEYPLVGLKPADQAPRAPTMTKWVDHVKL